MAWNAKLKHDTINEMQKCGTVTDLDKDIFSLLVNRTQCCLILFPHVKYLHEMRKAQFTDWALWHNHTSPRSRCSVTILLTWGSVNITYFCGLGKKWILFSLCRVQVDSGSTKYSWSSKVLSEIMDKQSKLRMETPQKTFGKCEMCAQFKWIQSYFYSTKLQQQVSQGALYSKVETLE